jgi:hypothetical protein
VRSGALASPTAAKRFLFYIHESGACEWLFVARVHSNAAFYSHVWIARRVDSISSTRAKKSPPMIDWLIGNFKGPRKIT